MLGYSQRSPLPLASVRYFFNKASADTSGNGAGQLLPVMPHERGGKRSLYPFFSIPPFPVHCKGFLLKWLRRASFPASSRAKSEIWARTARPGHAAQPSALLYRFLMGLHIMYIKTTRRRHGRTRGVPDGSFQDLHAESFLVRVKSRLFLDESNERRCGRAYAARRPVSYPHDRQKGRYLP